MDCAVWMLTSYLCTTPHHLKRLVSGVFQEHVYGKPTIMTSAQICLSSVPFSHCLVSSLIRPACIAAWLWCRMHANIGPHPSVLMPCGCCTLTPSRKSVPVNPSFESFFLALRGMKPCWHSQLISSGKFLGHSVDPKGLSRNPSLL